MVHRGRLRVIEAVKGAGGGNRSKDRMDRSKVGGTGEEKNRL